MRFHGVILGNQHEIWPKQHNGKVRKNLPRVDWFQLEHGQYVTGPADAEGMLHSHTFPGLRLAVPALLRGDLADVLAEVQQGLASAEHQAFVEAWTAAMRTQP